MGMPAESLITTVQQLLALPEDDLKHELLDGEHVVTPTPRMDHQRVVRALYDALRKAFDTHDNLELFPVGGDIELSSRTLVVPDLFVIPKNPDAPIRSCTAKVATESVDAATWNARSPAMAAAPNTTRLPL